jgi:single-stranded-DNA-specific exonuclease
VIGIVASRLVERFHRPVVLIAGGGEAWKGSGRSTGAFDLHAGLAASSGHLEQFGGHRAAAGLSIRPENVEAFAEAFAEHADSKLSDDDLRQRTVVDAVVAGTELTLDLCAELRRLAPFGLGNPGVTLLLPSCELGNLAPVGDGKHLRFRVRERGQDAGSAIAFGLGAQLDRFRRPGRYDVVFRLEENHWNGTVAPQLVIRRVLDAPEGYESLREWLTSQWRIEEANRTPEAQAIFTELGLTADATRRRPLLESEAFRALLEEPALARAA